MAEPFCLGYNVYMKTGEGIFIFLIVVGMGCEVFDSSSVPIIAILTNIIEIVLIISGSLKLMELFNTAAEKQNGTSRN